MLSIGIEPADNGVIKTLVDDNVNGGGEEFESRQVYEFDGPMKRSNQAKFLKDLVFDLGLDIGTQLDPDAVTINIGPGQQYVGSEHEIKNRIQVLSKEIKRLESIIEK
jgi:hypothetical protein|tara:strand:+ start:1873 stop:2196 length:324 start_codon:yes stop_codon:yes gene_type:complete